MFYKNQRLGLVIDGQAINTAAKLNNVRIDWKKLQVEFAKRGAVVRMSYVTTVREDGSGHIPNKPLIDFLDLNGFEVTAIEQRLSSHDGQDRLKGSATPSFIMKAVEMSDIVEHMVLFTGDGDLVPLVEFIKRKGVRVSVLSTLEEGGAIAEKLRRAADNFIDLRDLKDTIAMEDSRAHIARNYVSA